MKNTLSIILLLTLTGCHSVKEINFESIYAGYSSKGKHTRGLANKNDLIVISGYDGIYTKTNLKGEISKTLKINNLEDFRDVHINKDESILLLNSGNKGQIWKIDSNSTKKMVLDVDSIFLDGFSFYKNSGTGFAYGDPTNKKFNIYKTIDSGNSWSQINPNLLPNTLKNEAGFAASGTGIQTPSQNVIYIGTGMSDTARLFRSFDNGLSWDAINTPIKSGEYYGIYGMYFNSAKEGFICGGSYINPTDNDKIVFYTKNKGISWTNISNGLPGYMSCISGNDDLSLLVTTGKMGTYYSVNKGKTWILKSNTPYYTCLVTEKQIIYSGRDGIFMIENYTIKK